ncbi:ExbD/TolR family protein [Thiorhodospira sibirica]|uniref:ExbD/TolR family protein n=1 Tax=Thiorhodospira sibirica TaxID=154347 RepID=UPI00022C0556|nr:biopolymer transporter ExbD [Thiorhodospira sibirica]
MAFGSFNQGDDHDMAEINVIPLVDIMLVLLVIFIITAPVITHAVKIDLPQVSHERHETQLEHLTLSLDSMGHLYWNNEPIALERLRVQLQEAVAQNPDLEVHLRADQATPYAHIARILVDTRSSGVRRIGFITEPE